MPTPSLTLRTTRAVLQTLLPRPAGTQKDRAEKDTAQPSLRSQRRVSLPSRTRHWESGPVRSTQHSAIQMLILWSIVRPKLLESKPGICRCLIVQLLLGTVSIELELTIPLQLLKRLQTLIKRALWLFRWKLMDSMRMLTLFRSRLTQKVWKAIRRHQIKILLISCLTLWMKKLHLQLEYTRLNSHRSSSSQLQTPY